MVAVILIQGDDSVLVSQQVQTNIDELVGSGDRSLMVEELTQQSYMDETGLAHIAPLVNAVQTPPFLTEQRVVVGRHLSLFSKKDQVEPLAEAVASLLESVNLILVWEKSDSATRMAAIPKVLKEALTAVGATTINAVPKGKARKGFVEDKLTASALNLDQSARNIIADRLGDDLGSLDSLLETLLSAFGDGAKLTKTEVLPFLGEGSDVPPWDLTDAIDNGDIPLALENLSRMMVGGERHSLQILATLHGHYQKAMLLDGSGVTNQNEAAQILGLKGSTFPAQKALNLSKKLGSKKIKHAIKLLATADLDVRGQTALDAVVVTEVLVARLASMAR